MPILPAFSCWIDRAMRVHTEQLKFLTLDTRCIIMQGWHF